MRRISLALKVVLVASLAVAAGCGFVPFTSTAEAEPVVVLEMDDPVGDDYGPGTYAYPTHKAFTRGLFDLTHVKVSHDPEYVYFDATFKEITNPWNAPEGFSHQLINVYIDAAPGAGRTDTLRKGALVSFDRRYAWDVFIKALGWGGCRVFTAHDEPEARGIADGLSASVLADGKTVRIAVPKALMGEPSRKWGYYVLIGSQDAFGEDDFRPVMEKAGPWVFGGGSDLDTDPNVIDLLAPARGRASQERMLGSYDLHRGSLAVLVPVFATGGVRGGVPAGAVAASAVLASAAGVLIWWTRRRRKGSPPRK